MDIRQSDRRPRAQICNKLHGQRLTMSEIMAVKQLHPTFDEVMNCQAIVSKLGALEAFRAGVVFGQWRSDNVINFLKTSKNKLDTAAEKETLRLGFRIDTMLGDKTVEISALTKTWNMAGQMCMLT